MILISVPEGQHSALVLEEDVGLGGQASRERDACLNGNVVLDDVARFPCSNVYLVMNLLSCVVNFCEGFVICYLKLAAAWLEQYSPTACGTLSNKTSPLQIAKRLLYAISRHCREISRQN